MRFLTICLLLFLVACSTSPGKLKKLTRNGIAYQRNDMAIDMAGTGIKLSIQYTGCGGLFIQRDSSAIMIDPFFSNQRVMRIGSSVFGRGQLGKRKISSDAKMITAGMTSLEKRIGNLEGINAILSAHSHYDHLMDVPAIFDQLQKRPTIYLNRSGYNTCYNVIDTARMKVLEKHMTTREIQRPPIAIPYENGQIHIYPILADHNPHFKYVKFFSGSKTKPVADYKEPFGKTRANDWLEGSVFSFLIDYVSPTGGIEFRIFVQSSSCNPPAGIPPPDMLKGRQVDVAFLGLVSFQFSTEYPCEILKSMNPRRVVWIHWEDFFRKYTKDPKTVRGTDVVKFFDLPCVRPYKSEALLPWPGVAYHFK